jgi:hypothetical protein
MRTLLTIKTKKPLCVAAYGHMGRTPETVTKTFSAPGGHENDYG